MKITDERKGTKMFGELKNCDVFSLKSSDESVGTICMKAAMYGQPKCINLENGKIIDTLEDVRYVELLDAELIIRG